MNRLEKSVQPYYQIILDSIADGVFTVDLDFQITSFNKAAEDITGIARKKVIGRNCFDIFKTDICQTRCLLKETMKNKKPAVNMPVHIIRADGKRIPISASAALLKNAAGRIIGGVETFRDLTAVQKLRRALLKQHCFDDIVSRNDKMLKLFSVLPRIAESSSTVLIEGASGTGKELVARAIHNHSPRKDAPFVAVNCGALPDTLCESELFGYKAGAFTDAKKDKPGRFALAQNGTIFLDEIGDISPAVQMRLLRVLEEKVYEPLGSTKTVPTNARVLAGPGNIHELENTIEHAFVLYQDELIHNKHLPERIIPNNGSLLMPTGVTLKEIEKRAIETALRKNQWKRVATARELGINKNTLRRKIQRLGITENF